MRTERNGPDGRQRAVRYYISSRSVDAEAPYWHWSATTGGNPSGGGNGLHRTLDVPFREDNCRLRRDHGPAVMGILRRAALNIVRMVQQNFKPDLSIRLLRDKIRRNPVLLIPRLAKTRPFDFPVYEGIKGLLKVSNPTHGIISISVGPATIQRSVDRVQVAVHPQQ